MQRAVLLMFVAMSLIPTGDSAGKLLTGSFGTAPIFVAWSRFAIGMLCLMPFVPRSAYALLKDWRIWLRAATLALGISCIQTALKTEEIATVFAAFFVGPLVSYLLAAVFLRETVTWMRSLLIVTGFAGVLLVVRPGGDTGAGLLWALAAGCSYGVFLTMSRWLGEVGTPLALTYTQVLIAALILLPFGWLTRPDVSPQIVGLTLASGICSMLGNLLLLYAYRLAPATRLAPLVYFQLIAAVSLGWAIFGDLPDAMTWLGLFVILGAGLVSTRLR